MQGRWLGIPPDEVRSEISAGKVAGIPSDEVRSEISPGKVAGILYSPDRSTIILLVSGRLSWMKLAISLTTPSCLSYLRRFSAELQLFRTWMRVCR